MAIWAKHTTKCRICGKKVAKDRLVCTGNEREVSDWFRRSFPSVDKKSTVWYNYNLLYATDKYYYENHAYWRNVRQSAIGYFKDHGVDLNDCEPIHGENSECLRKLNVWAVEKKRTPPDSGIYTDDLAVLLDEYLEAH